jgi:hypothetical protein
MASVGALAKAAIISGLIKSITGVEPQVIDKGETVSLEFNDQQKNIIRAKIQSMLDAKPGEIRIDLVGLAGPVLMKKLWWAIGIPAGLGFFAGWSVGRQRKG